MNLIELILYFSMILALSASIWLCSQSYGVRGRKSGYDTLPLQPHTSIIFFSAGIFFIVYALLNSDLMISGALVLWIIGLGMLFYDISASGKTFSRVRKFSWNKMIFGSLGSVYGSIGIFLLTLYIIPISFLELIYPIDHNEAAINLSVLIIWSLCLTSFTVAARRSVPFPSGPGSSEIREEMLDMPDDVLVTRAYSYLINRLIAGINPASLNIRETVLEFLEQNPIIFQGCSFNPDETIDFEPAVANITRMEETGRVRQICLIFSSLCMRILKINRALTSAEFTETILIESFNAARDKFNSSPLFVEILRSLPEGVLEDERVVLLSKKELETRVRERTRELEKAKNDLSHLLEELQAAEANLRRIITKNADSIVIMDEDKIVKFVNPAAESLFGRRAEEWLGKKFEYPVKIDDLLEVEITDINGDKKVAEIRTVEVEWEERKANLASVRDITDRIKNEEERRQLEAQLQQAQKLEAVGTLAGGIAHDFNNILAAIMGFTELTSIELPAGHPMKRNLEQVLIAGRRAKALIQQILSFARPTEQEKQPVQLNVILNEAVAFARASLPATIEINYNADTESSVIMADPTQIHQVLMNLFANAGHAMAEKGGALNISLTRVELNADSALLFNLEPGNYVRVIISDTGHGMDDRTLQRIFEPFFTTKGPGEGTGLGLSVVHGIVRSHFGEINVESKVGQGSTFTIYLPLVSSEIEEHPAITLVPLPRGSERILFVDDEAAVARLGQKILEKQGYKVTSLTSSLEALKVFRERPDDFDLVVSDMTMPQMTGLNLTREMIKIRPDIPIIICTGFLRQVSPDQAKELGIKRLLLKPLAFNEVVTAVRLVLNESAAEKN